MTDDFQVFQGRTHYTIVNIAINAKNMNAFATACLDRTVKVWSIPNPTPTFNLDAHEKGSVTAAEYYHGNDKSYMIATGDDKSHKSLTTFERSHPNPRGTST